MRIAFVVHDYHRQGGHSRYVSELAERFAREHEVHVYANRIDKSGTGEGSDIRFHRVQAWRRTALTTIFSFLVPATLALPAGFDIVHAQGLCSFRFNVLTSHVCGAAWHRERAKGERLRWYDHLFNLLVNPLEGLMYRAARSAPVIAISEQVKRDLRECYGREENVEVVYHGVELGVFHPSNRSRYRAELRATLGYQESDFVALFVGDMRKGAVPCMRALARVPGAKLLIVSRTKTEFYRDAAREAGVEDRVLFHPPTGQIERFYGAADTFLFPSSYDAFGMVVTEAMACGLPVITSLAAGASELIDHGRNGLLIKDAFSDEEIASALDLVAGNRELCARLGAAARVSVEKYTWDWVAAETMKVYRKRLSGSVA